MRGAGAALFCPTGLPLGPGGTQSPSPPRAGGEHAGWESPWLRAGQRTGGLVRTPLLPIPGIAAVRPENRQLRGGRRCRRGGDGSRLPRDEPRARARRGEGAAGGSRTRCWDRPALRGAGPGHHLLPPSPSCLSPPSLLPPPHPGPGLILTLALLLRSCESRARPLKPKERARGCGGPGGDCAGCPLRQCRGSTRGQGGGQEGGLASGQRQGGKMPVSCRSSLLYSTSCCCWVASLTTCQERRSVRHLAVPAPEPRVDPRTTPPPPGATMHSPPHHGFRWF